MMQQPPGAISRAWSNMPFASLNGMFPSSKTYILTVLTVGGRDCAPNATAALEAPSVGPGCRTGGNNTGSEDHHNQQLDSESQASYMSDMSLRMMRAQYSGFRCFGAWF